MEKNRKFYNFNWGVWLLHSVVVWSVMLTWWQMFYSFLPIKANQGNLYIGTYIISTIVLLLIAGGYKKISMPIVTLLLAVGIWKYHIVFASAINHLVNAFFENYYTTVEELGSFEVYVTDARTIGIALAVMGIPLVCILAVVLRTGKGKILAVIIFLLPFVVAGLGVLIGSQVESVKEYNVTAYKDARKATSDTITKTMREWKEPEASNAKKDTIEDSTKDVTVERSDAEVDENLITGIIAGKNSVNLTDQQNSNIKGTSDMANLKALAYFEPAGKNLGTVALDEKPQKTIYVTKHYGGNYHGNSWSARSDTDEVLEDVRIRDGCMDVL